MSLYHIALGIWCFSIPESPQRFLFQNSLGCTLNSGGCYSFSHKVLFLQNNSGGQNNGGGHNLYQIFFHSQNNSGGQNNSIGHNSGHNNVCGQKIFLEIGSICYICEYLC